ncbi:50S ribosomal protein L5 [Candidatus Woesearchaeota archaeon]|jgi:large subunit ribosomal protein L5|nr:50S ribosomal protein L5 [Candidatus Woesearchaeota archaeon]MBT7238068.1 50S ribosomal protein L5 [Candidatus Woesearchaeota archaeon]
MNKMREIKIEKLTLNMGAGEAGNKLEKYTMLLNKITGKKPIQRISNKRIPTWQVRPGLAIGTKVTIRGKAAAELLKRLLVAVDNTIKPKSFDKEGNFAFGIPEYIDIPEMEYIVEIGIVGLEVAVTLERAGFRIKKRKFNIKKIPIKHRITSEEAQEFMRTKYNAKIGEEEEK